MEQNVFHELEKRVEEIEKEYGSLENFVVNSTITDEKHRMRMEEQNLSTYKEMSLVYQSLSDLELADLFDFQKLAGSFDGEFS